MGPFGTASLGSISAHKLIYYKDVESFITNLKCFMEKHLEVLPEEAYGMCFFIKRFCDSEAFLNFSVKCCHKHFWLS